MKTICSLAIALFAALLISSNASAQCEGRYETEIFSGFTKTTVQYSDVYEVRPGDGNYLKMDIYQPDGDTFRRRPVVIMAHGGTFIAGDRNEPTSTEVCKLLVKRGFVTASIDYRLAGSQAELFDSINALRIALRAVSDMKAAVRYFKKDAAMDNLLRIDPQQIFVGGNSAGAIAAIHAAYVTDTTELPSYIKPIVAQMGGVDGNSGNPGYSSHVSGVINLAGGINKLNWIKQGDVPMVSCHGTNDNTVPYQCDDVLYAGILDLVDLCGSGAMKTWCDQIGTDNILHTYQGDGHVPWENNTAKRNSMLQQVGDFMKTYTVCDTTTFLREIKNDFTFNIFPNPANDLLKITLNDFQENATVIIYDGLGKDVKSVTLDNTTTVIDISSLNNGRYFIKIVANSGKIAAKAFHKI